MNMRPPLDSDLVAPVPTLVLIHDARGSQVEWASLSQILVARLVPFDLLEIPGYTHERGRPTFTWRAWLRDAGEVLDRHHGAGERIVLGGLGTGAALAAALALERRPQQVCGVALLSPTFRRAKLDPVDSSRSRIASALRLDRWVPVVQREPFGVRNAKTRKWIVRELEERGISPVGPARIDLRALRESDRLHARVRSTVATSSLPLLVLHATDDEVAPVEAIEAIVAEWGDRAKLVALAHSHHRIAVDNDRQRVAHELADFVGAPKRAAIEPVPTRRSSRPSREDCRA